MTFRQVAKRLFAPNEIQVSLKGLGMTTSDANEFLEALHATPDTPKFEWNLAASLEFYFYPLDRRAKYLYLRPVSVKLHELAQVAKRVSMFEFNSKYTIKET